MHKQEYFIRSLTELYLSYEDNAGLRNWSPPVLGLLPHLVWGIVSYSIQVGLVMKLTGCESLQHCEPLCSAQREKIYIITQSFILIYTNKIIIHTFYALYDCIHHNDSITSTGLLKWLTTSTSCISRGC